MARPCPTLALKGHTDTSVYALVLPGPVRVFQVDPGPPLPGYTSRTTRWSSSAGVPAAPPAELADVLLGSVLAAPVDRLSGLVTWPVNTGPATR